MACQPAPRAGMSSGPCVQSSSPQRPFRPSRLSHPRLPHPSILHSTFTFSCRYSLLDISPGSDWNTRSIGFTHHLFGRFTFGSAHIHVDSTTFFLLLVSSHPLPRLHCSSSSSFCFLLHIDTCLSMQQVACDNESSQCATLSAVPHGHADTRVQKHRSLSLARTQSGAQWRMREGTRGWEGELVSSSHGVQHHVRSKCSVPEDGQT